jgi:hypothetical protein
MVELLDGQEAGRSKLQTAGQSEPLAKAIGGREFRGFKRLATCERERGI